MELVGETRCSRELPILLHSKNESAKYHKIFKKKKIEKPRCKANSANMSFLRPLAVQVNLFYWDGPGNVPCTCHMVRFGACHCPGEPD